MIFKRGSKNDSTLIDQTLSGDKNAYNLLVKKHQQVLRHFIASRCKYSGDVDDLAQETFIIAYHKLSLLQNKDTFRSWLCGIGLNLVRNHHRKFNPTKLGDDSALNTLISAELEKEITLDSEHFSFAALRECIAELNSQGKELISLHYQQSLSVTQLTQKLNLKHSTITMRLHRTRALLKQCITHKIAREQT